MLDVLLGVIRWRVRLSELMVRSLSLEDLGSVCFRLGIDLDDIGGETKRGKIERLIEYCQRRSILSDLVRACMEVNPSASWRDLLLPQPVFIFLSIIRSNAQPLPLFILFIVCLSFLAISFAQGQKSGQIATPTATRRATPTKSIFTPEPSSLMLPNIPITSRIPSNFYFLISRPVVQWNAAVKVVDKLDLSSSRSVTMTLVITSPDGDGLLITVSTKTNSDYTLLFKDIKDVSSDVVIKPSTDEKLHTPDPNPDPDSYYGWYTVSSLECEDQQKKRYSCVVVIYTSLSLTPIPSRLLPITPITTVTRVTR